MDRDRLFSLVSPIRAGDDRTRLPAVSVPYVIGMTTKFDPKPTALTVYYDGACPLCAVEIRTYRRSLGGETIAFVDVGADDSSEALGPGLTLAAARARFHVRDGEGRVWSGAMGFSRLWRQLPGWRWLAILVSLPGVAPLAEAGYRLFLPVRPSLARLLLRLGVLSPSRCGEAGDSEAGPIR